MCTIDGDEAAVAKAKEEAAEAEEDAKAPPPEVVHKLHIIQRFFLCNNAVKSVFACSA